MEALRCQVTSPCGRYCVVFSCEGCGPGGARLCLRVSRNPHLTAPPPPDGAATATAAAPRDDDGGPFSAALGEADVEALTAAAGVTKDMRLFALMTYNALLGKTPCVTFAVQTVRDLRASISAGATQKDGEEEEEEGGEEQDGDALVFVLNYEVDFTRALFPVPLHRSSDDSAPSSPAAAAGRLPSAVRGAPVAASAAAPAGVPRVVYDDHGALELRVEALARENARLASQNRALQRLSKEKLAEMTRQCAQLEAQADAQGEARRLQRQVTELQRRLRDEQHTSAGLRREVDRLRSRLGGGSPAPSRSTTPTRSASRPVSVGTAAESRARSNRFNSPRGRSAGDSPLPRGRPALSRAAPGSQLQRRTRSPSHDSLASDRSAASRRSRGSAANNRFSTPPSTPPRRGARTTVDYGGARKAPPSPPPSPLFAGRRSSSGGGAWYGGRPVFR